MAGHERPYDIKIKFILPATKKEVKFNMRTTIWSLDMNLQSKSLTPKQELNPKELWIGRLIDCVEGMTDEKLRVIDQYTMNYLCNKWLEYNDPNSSFLDLVNPEVSLKNTTMSKSD